MKPLALSVTKKKEKSFKCVTEMLVNETAVMKYKEFVYTFARIYKFFVKYCTESSHCDYLYVLQMATGATVCNFMSSCKIVLKKDSNQATVFQTIIPL